MNKKPKNIEQLYSESFINFRVEPSSGLWKSISSKLAWRNFFSFNPTAFNAYYVAGILTLSVAGALWITNHASDDNQIVNEITVNNTIEKPIVTAVQDESQKVEAESQKTETSEQKAVGSWQLKEDSIQKPVTIIQHPASSAVVSTKADNPELITPDPELVTRIVSRSEAKVDNPQPVTPHSPLATPHPKPTQHQSPRSLAKHPGLTLHQPQLYGPGIQDRIPQRIHTQYKRTNKRILYPRFT